MKRVNLITASLLFFLFQPFYFQQVPEWSVVKHGYDSPLTLEVYDILGWEIPNKGRWDGQPVKILPEPPTPSDVTQPTQTGEGDIIEGDSGGDAIIIIDK